MIAENQENKAKNRTSGIGGSDIAGIMSLPPYGCARRTFYQKLGKVPDYPISAEDNPIERGNELEPIILKKYERQTGRTVVEADEVRDPEFPFLMAHPDGMVLAADRGLGVVEAKAPGPFMLREFYRKGLSEGYILQMQWYLGLSGLKWGAYAIHDVESWRVRPFDVDPDPVLFAAAKEQAIDFWGKVQREEEPARLDPKSKQCQKCEYRASCQGAALLDIAADKDAGEIQNRPELVQICNAYVEAKELAAEAEEYAEQVKAEFQEQLGEKCQAADIPGYRIYWRPQTAMRADAKAIEKACRDEAETLKQIGADLIVAIANDGPGVNLDFLVREVTSKLAATAERIATLPTATKKPWVSRPFRYFAR